jgi:hypothetical protein
MMAILVPSDLVLWRKLDECQKDFSAALIDI